MINFLKRGIFSWFLILSAATVWISINAYRSGPPPFTTNAPGESSCATSPACHVDSFSIHPGFGDFTVMGGVPANGYKPGETLTLMPYTMGTGDSVIGFETVAELADGSAAGQVLISDAYRTQLVNHNGLQYVMHTAAGTDHPGMHDWMYEWIAPPKGSGPVMFYVTFVSANNDHTAGGDKIYTDTLLLKEDISAGIRQTALSHWSVALLFPNPVSDILNIQIDNPKNQLLTLRILNIEGKILLERKTDTNGLVVCHTDSFQPGIKILQISKGNNLFSKAFVKY